MHSLPLLVCALLAAPAPLLARVTQARPDSLLVQDSRTVRATPAQTYAALIDVGRWWSPDHTYSGRAANLSLQAAAGGCFCERWKNHSVQHLQVLRASRDQLLRLQGALGPLQELAVQGVMTFSLKAVGQGTELTFQYRVNGTADSALDKLASAVDGMLMQQLDRLQRHVETGKADASPP